MIQPRFQIGQRVAVAIPNQRQRPGTIVGVELVEGARFDSEGDRLRTPLPDWYRYQIVFDGKGYPEKSPERHLQPWQPKRCELVQPDGAACNKAGAETELIESASRGAHRLRRVMCEEHRSRLLSSGYSVVA